jgi:hypothetical protein
MSTRDFLQYLYAHEETRHLARSLGDVVTQRRAVARMQVTSGALIAPPR